MYDKESLLKVWRKDHFTLRLRDTYTRDEYGKSILAYEFKDGHNVIFDGTDFHASPLHAIDSLEIVTDILSFLSIGEEDVEPEYFERQEYTPQQIAWRDSMRREELSMIVMYLEEYIEHKNRNRSHR